MIKDPVKAAEIVSLLNVDPGMLSTPQVYRKVEDVINYFAPFDNMRYYILKVTSGKHGDKLEHAWNYVALQKEREAILSRFTAEEFAPDIEQQLSEKYLTRDNMVRIRQDIDTKKDLLAERERNRQQTAEVAKQTSSAMKKINLNEVESNLNDLEKVNQIIDKYE